MGVDADQRLRASNEPENLPMRIGADWRDGASCYEVRDPYRGSAIAYCPQSTLADVDAALDAAVAAKRSMAAMPGYQRAELLRRAATGLRERQEQLATTISRETGKALKDARAEIARTLDTISLSAEEAVRIEGEHVPLDATPMGAGKIAMLLPFPVGVVAGITPFNAPVNLAAHKIAPALAAGNVVVLKPSPQAPLSVHRLVEIFVAAGVPPGALNSLYGAEAGPALVRDPRVDFISFTGSPRAGADVKAASGLRRVALELGGIGPTIVHADANIDEAATMCARNAMRLAGQSCISVQNVHVHAAIVAAFLPRLLAAVRALKVGDPLSPDTDVGTLIDEAAAQRVESWIADAVAQGASVLAGGTRRGAQLDPTVLVSVRDDMKVVCEEVFGPTITVAPFERIEDVFESISNSRFGLQCGVFTASLEVAISAVKSIRSGAVIVNGTSTWRTDQLPYGGIKHSGMGREGPRYAIREMTDQRLVVFNF